MTSQSQTRPDAAPSADLEAVIRPLGHPGTALFRIAFICSANQFRSALAEAVCSHLLVGVSAEVDSFGILDMPSNPPLQPAIDVARELEIDLSHHRSRRLKPGALEHMDVVIGFDDSHVAAAVVDGGAAPERTFLLTELVQLLLAAGAGTTAKGVPPKEMIQRLNSARQLVGYDSFPAIPDLAHASPAAQRAIAVKVAELVACTIPAIFKLEDEPGTSKLMRRLDKLNHTSSRRERGSWRLSRARRETAHARNA